jgi:hypothetical protein
MSNSSRVELAFRQAKLDFEKDLKDPKILQEIKQTTSMHQVYETALKIQEEQGRTGKLRHFRKIEPYLKRLREFESAINVFAQTKADLLSPIWGSIKLLLVLTSTLSQSFDAIRDVMSDIGFRLPFFEAYTNLFTESTRIADVLCLFYRDILDFHLTALNFFSTSRELLVL